MHHAIPDQRNAKKNGNRQYFNVYAINDSE